ncbi:MAG: 4-hydroxy-tetrahydrodipicolinate reductase, partial [Clostridia bacterium]|nr:4-hydroxy-tetrahydrodipicolinate reductase [Clostridia bacterium]
MKVIVNGANGYMGRLTVEEFEKAGHNVVAKIDTNGEGFLRSFDEVKEPADLLVDFSFHTTAKAVCDYALKNNIPVVIATTGHTEEEKSYIYAAA